MIGAAITVYGFEDVCKRELESLGAKKGILKKGFVSFEVKNEVELSKISYKAHTTSRIINLLCELTISKDMKNAEKEVRDSVENISVNTLFKDNKTFKVECEREGEHDFKSSEFESLLGKILIESVDKKSHFKPKVSMDNPDIIIYANIREEICIFGIDFCGFDTSKRDYHIFVNKIAIRGALGACLSLFADIKKGKTVLDPFSSSGTIVIETALLSNNISPHNFRKEEFIFRKIDALKDTDWDIFFKKVEKKPKNKRVRIIATDPLLANVQATTKNAKIAGVQKFIEAGRADIEWLDTKIDKSSVDIVITRLPSVSRSNNEKDIEKLYKEFFYQLEYILKKNGKVVIIILEEKLMISVAKEYKFKDIDMRVIKIGKLPLKVVTLEFNAGG